MDYLLDQWRLLLAGDTQGIFFWGAFYTLLLLLYSLIHQRRIARWPWTEGTLLSGDIETFGPQAWATADQEYTARVKYRYEVDGKPYEGHRLSPWIFVASRNARLVLQKQLDAIHWLPDGRVKVFYKPTRHGKSFLIKPGPVGQAITALVAVLPLVLYWFRYHA